MQKSPQIHHLSNPSDSFTSSDDDYTEGYSFYGSEEFEIEISGDDIGEIELEFQEFSFTDDYEQDSRQDRNHQRHRARNRDIEVYLQNEGDNSFSFEINIENGSYSSDDFESDDDSAEYEVDIYPTHQALRANLFQHPGHRFDGCQNCMRYTNQFLERNIFNRVSPTSTTQIIHYSELDESFSEYFEEESEEPQKRVVDLSKLNLIPVRSRHIKYTCSVCLSDFAKGEKMAKLSCNHLFHQKCIVPWLESNDKCPNCRKKVEL